MKRIKSELEAQKLEIQNTLTKIEGKWDNYSQSKKLFY
jgi:hypothetical protein